MEGDVLSAARCRNVSCVLQEVMVNVGDVGEDYEHGVQLLKKLSEFRGAAEGVSDRVALKVHCGISGHFEAETATSSGDILDDTILLPLLSCR